MQNKHNSTQSYFLSSYRIVIITYSIIIIANVTLEFTKKKVVPLTTKFIIIISPHASCVERSVRFSFFFFSLEHPSQKQREEQSASSDDLRTICSRQRAFSNRGFHNAMYLFVGRILLIRSARARALSQPARFSFFVSARGCTRITLNVARA